MDFLYIKSFVQNKILPWIQDIFIYSFGLNDFFDDAQTMRMPVLF
jgi:hypothetical protein